MELHQALTEIAAIRRQIAAAEKFRGYRAWPVACGAFLAFAGSAFQAAIWVEDPLRDLRAYLSLWVTVAVIAGALPALDVYAWHRRPGKLRGTLARLACEQFAPCVVAGGLLTWVIARYAPGVGWMLPGLWAVLFSLGMFASFRLLPWPIFAIGLWYLLSGCVCLALGPERAGLAPWTMSVTFGLGQLATAAVLLRQGSDGGND